MSIVSSQSPRCPICRSRRFEPHAGRESARCGGCGALERHRALARIHGSLLENGGGRRALEIGPLNRQVFGAFLRDRGWTYVSIDKSRRGNPNDPRAVDFVDFESDATELVPIADESVDLVIVQHVIEEITDYERALTQIIRVLDPSGTALLEIPFDPSRGDSQKHPPDNFGNVWAFGQELITVVREQFGSVRVDDYNEGSVSGHILTCRKSESAAMPQRPSSRPAPLPDTSPVARENALPGDDTWWAPAASPGAIEGYASQCSLRPGGYLRLHVSTDPPQRYRITVYRLGWYGGAGARAVASCPNAGSDVQGTPRQMPHVSPGPRIESAGWPVTDSVYVGEDWMTGVYVARLELTTGTSAGECSYVPFVVRPALGVLADILVQQPFATAQAHNNFGGKSLLSANSTDQVAANEVTFDRPLPTRSTANASARWPFEWDYQLVRFLEREGFDVAYTTDVDTHREPWSLLGYRLLIMSGHGACYTPSIRDALDFAVSEGANLACIGANPCSWEVRFEDEYHAMVDGRHGAGPQPGASRERHTIGDPDRSGPKCLPLAPYCCEDNSTNASFDYELTTSGAQHPWLGGAGFAAAASLRGLVGYAWDSVESSVDATGSTVFFHSSPSDLPPADCAAHRLDSGAVVFAAGSVQLSWGLDDWGRDGHVDTRLQHFMRNVIRALAAGPHAPGEELPSSTDAAPRRSSAPA